MTDSAPSSPDAVMETSPHTRAKHEILRRYLGAWFGIMGHRATSVLYIDGFCGSGVYEDGGKGSPFIALDTATGSCKRWSTCQEATFIFIDEKKANINTVNDRVSRRIIPDNFHIFVEHNTFEGTVPALLDHVEQTGASLPPSFSFVDPFGVKGFTFATLQRILRNQSSEVFIFLNVDGIRRCLGSSEPITRQHVIKLFGVPNPWSLIKGNTFDGARDLYQKQLKRLVTFVRYFELRDEYDNRQFCLFFASNSAKGHAEIKNAFWKVDPHAGMAFSDATDPNQPVLFGPSEFVPQQLADLLVSKFKGATVSASEIERFVLDKTPYVKTHKTQALALLKAGDKLRSYDGSTPYTGRGFPDRLHITFD